MKEWQFGFSPGLSYPDETDEEREAEAERYRVGEAAKRVERKLAKNRNRQLNSEAPDDRSKD